MINSPRYAYLNGHTITVILWHLVPLYPLYMRVSFEPRKMESHERKFLLPLDNVSKFAAQDNKQMAN